MNEECVCGAGASDGFPDGWTDRVSKSRDEIVGATEKSPRRSSLGLNGRRVVSRAQLGQLSAGA